MNFEEFCEQMIDVESRFFSTGIFYFKALFPIVFVISFVLVWLLPIIFNKFKK